MGKALYRKYRSRSLDEIVGQEHITSTLKNAISAGNISHAYLFTGPRGVGKTSIARILAHEINQLPYDEEATHLDIIEIDAASNRRIDEIRDLRERVHIAPSSSKYKVYIIDEVHMLTKEAFNALLKTLEEPPAHAVFILATTEAHKLPDTIISRTQRYTFRPVEQNKVIAHLRHITSEEGFTVDDEGLALLAHHGGGSFRDSISMLDQARGRGESIGLKDVQELLGIAPDDLLQSILMALEAKNMAGLMEALSDIKQQGYHAAGIAKQLANALRQQLFSSKDGLSQPEIIQLLDQLLEVPTAHDQTTKLELILLGFACSDQPTPARVPQNTSPAKDHQQPVSVAPSKTTQTPLAQPKDNAMPKAPAPEPAESKAQPAAKQPEAAEEIASTVSSADAVQLDENIWRTTLETLKLTHNTLYSVARMAEPRIDGDEITLVFKFAFHQKRIDEVKNKQVIADVLQKVTGKSVQITCVTGGAATSPVQAAQVSEQKSADLPVTDAPPKTAANDPLSAISNIFGSAEVLES